MKSNFKIVLILSLFASMFFYTCQDEVVEVTQNESETFDPTSGVANLVKSTASNDGTVDDIMDNADCFTVNLPVTIVANGITITINTLNDLELLQDIFDEFQNDDDVLEFLFPITIILNDYTEVVIENEDQLEDFIEDCFEDEDDVIECVDFVYPISFSIFNTDFAIIDTVVINNDEELYNFLDELENPNGGAIIASLNYPVSLVYADGTVVEVNSNLELAAAISAAEEECDDSNEDDCDKETIDMYLVECHWELAQNPVDQSDIEFYFGVNGNLEVVNEETNQEAQGTWVTSETDQGIVLTITGLGGFADDFNGSWVVTNCDDEWLVLLGENANNTVELIIERECDDEADCSAQEISANLKECIWYAENSLYDTAVVEVFTFNEDGTFATESSNGAIVGFWYIELTDEGVFLILESDQEPYSLLAIEWLIIECDDDRIKGVNGDHYIVFEQECENAFDCFEDLTIAVCDEDDVNDGMTAFDLNQIYANCPNDDVEVSFHASVGDAQTDVNALSSPYTNTQNPETIYARVALAGNNSVYEIFEVHLIVEDCSQAGCTEEEVDDYLMECHWIAVNINGSDDFSNFDIYFNSNQELIITGNGATLSGNWITTGNPNDGVYVVISELDANFQIFNEEWLVVECSEEFMHLQNGNNNLILERDCN